MHIRNYVESLCKLWLALSLIASSCDATPADGTYICNDLAECKRFDKTYESCVSLVDNDALKLCYRATIKAKEAGDGGPVSPNEDAGKQPRASGLVDAGESQDASGVDAASSTSTSPNVIGATSGGSGGSTSTAESNRPMQPTGGMQSAGSGGVAGTQPSEHWAMLDCNMDETTHCENFDEARNDGKEFGSTTTFWCVGASDMCDAELQTRGDGQGMCFVSNPARTGTPRIATSLSKADQPSSSIQVEFDFFANETTRPGAIMAFVVNHTHTIDLSFEDDLTYLNVYHFEREVSRLPGPRLRPQTWTNVALRIADCTINECTARVRIGTEQLKPVAIGTEVLSPNIDLYFGLGPLGDHRYENDPPDIEARYDNVIMSRTPR